MSIQSLDKLGRMSSLSDGDFRILFQFADHENDEDGLAFPSISTVAVRTGKSIKTVRRAVAKFREQGLLKVHREASGAGYPTQYRVNLRALGPIPDRADIRSQAVKLKAKSKGTPVVDSADEDVIQQSLLPDDDPKRGDTHMSPLSDAQPVDNSPVDKKKGGQKRPKGGTKTAKRGDTHMSPESVIINHRERSVDRPDENSRIDDARVRCDLGTPEPIKRMTQGQSPGKKKKDKDVDVPPRFHSQPIEEIVEQARKHALQPRQRWEQEHHFRTRVRDQVLELARLKQDCKRESLRHREPGESFEDFRQRVDRAVAKAKGISLGMSAENARDEIRQTLGN